MSCADWPSLRYNGLMKIVSAVLCLALLAIWFIWLRQSHRIAAVEERRAVEQAAQIRQQIVEQRAANPRPEPDAEGLLESDD